MLTGCVMMWRRRHWRRILSNMQKALHIVPVLLIFHRSGIIVATERMCGYKSAIKKEL